MLDDKDIKILTELSEDSTQQQKLLSDKARVSEGEFSKRKQRLISQGVIRNYTINIDYKKLGYHTVGYFIFSELIKVGEMSSALEFHLTSIPEIIDINRVFGRDLDYVLKIMTTDNEHFESVIGKIRNHPNVKSDGSFTAIIGKPIKSVQGIIKLA